MKSVGFESKIKIVNEYLNSTGEEIGLMVTLKELERFALWVVCNKIPIEIPEQKIPINPVTAFREYVTGRNGGNQAVSLFAEFLNNYQSPPGETENIFYRYAKSNLEGLPVMSLFDFQMYVNAEIKNGKI